MAGRFALGAAREVGRVLGPRAGLAALRPLLDAIEDVALRRTAHLDAIDLASRVDDATLAEMIARWAKLPAGGAFAAVAERCVALASEGRRSAALALASAEVERSPGSGRATYLRARVRDEAHDARADLERALWLARRDRDDMLAAAAASRLARLDFEPPRHPIDLASLEPPLRLPLLIAQLRARGRYGRVAALDGLVALAQTASSARADAQASGSSFATTPSAKTPSGKTPSATTTSATTTNGKTTSATTTNGKTTSTTPSTTPSTTTSAAMPSTTTPSATTSGSATSTGRGEALARAAIRACAEHADREARLTPIEVDRIRTALAHWPDPSARAVALGRLEARAALDSETADPVLGEALSRARAVLERGTAGPPGASLTVDWRALDAIAAMKRGEKDVADRIEALLAAIDAARPAPSAPLLSLAWLACASADPPLRAIGERLADRVVSLTGPQPSRGWLRLAERVADAALAERLRATARDHREVGATEGMVADLTRRAFAAHAAGQGDEALELLREAKRLAET